MKLGVMSIAGVGLAAGAVAAWFYLRPVPDDRAAGAGDTAVVEQPSGKVRSDAGQSGAAGGQPDGQGAAGSGSLADGAPAADGGPSETLETASASASDGAPSAPSRDANGDGSSLAGAGAATGKAADGAPAVTEPEKSVTSGQGGGSPPDDAAGNADGAPGRVARVDPSATTPDRPNADAPARAGDAAAVAPEITAPEDVATDPATVAPEDSVTSDGAAPGKAPAAIVAPEKGAPSFDLVRIDRDGQAVLAGQAQPNQKVEIVLDDQVIGTVTADGSGAFVAIVRTPLSGQPQNLQLRVAALGDAPVTGAAPASDGPQGDASADGTDPDQARPSAAETKSPGAGEKPEDAVAAGADKAAPGEDPAAPPSAVAPSDQATKAETERASNDGTDDQPGATKPEETGRLADDPPGDERAPKIRADAPDMAVPKVDDGAGTTAPGAGSGVNRHAGSSSLALSVPLTPGADTVVRGPSDTAKRAAPDRLAATGSADRAARAGGADDQMSGARQGPDKAASPAGLPGPARESDPVGERTLPAEPSAATGDEGGVRLGAAERPVSDRADPGNAPVEPGATDAPSAPDSVAERQFLTSPSVIILPGPAPDDAPTLLSSTKKDLRILQPSVSDIDQVVLDAITYGDTGAVVLKGRGRAGRAVRVYGNGVVVGTTQIATDGTWALSVPAEQGREIKLFRLDELDARGQVTTRVEAPFSYARSSPKLVRQRRVTIQQGDVLWRIAEQFYGEGLRYSVIYGANTKLIRDPDLIYPGQVFTVPELVDASPEP